jgi:hypothetical protein
VQFVDLIVAGIYYFQISPIFMHCLKKRLSVVQRSDLCLWCEIVLFLILDLFCLLLLSRMDEARQPLWRKVFIPSSKIQPYRMIIVLRLVIVAFFFRYRILNPVTDAYGLWLTSVTCEIWFAISWILDQFPKWLPINRETYLDRLSLR